MDAFELKDLIVQQQASGRAYLEFLRVATLSGGVYSLPKDGVDPQKPHTEDEVYVVLHGKASIRVGEEDRPVEAGSVIFVAANVDHQFHTITEDLTVLVFFAPAEYTNEPKSGG